MIDLIFIKSMNLFECREIETKILSVIPMKIKSLFAKILFQKKASEKFLIASTYEEKK